MKRMSELLFEGQNISNKLFLEKAFVDRAGFYQGLSKKTRILRKVQIRNPKAGRMAALEAVCGCELRSFRVSCVFLDSP